MAVVVSCGRRGVQQASSLNLHFMHVTNWEQDWCTREIVRALTSTTRRLERSLPVVVGKAHGHHVGKALHSAANL